MKMRTYHSHIPMLAKQDQVWRKHYLPNMALDIEIGCGVGMHPLMHAKDHPERFLIAIEKTREKFGKFSNKNTVLGPYSK